MVHTVLLGVHAAGSIGLLLGPLALAVPKRAGLWGLGLIAGATEAAALAGWAVGRRHSSGWLGWHIRLMCGSYLSFVTAALVVNWASPLAWVLPTAVGTPLIIRAVQRATHPSIRPSTSPPRPVRSGAPV